MIMLAEAAPLLAFPGFIAVLISLGALGTNVAFNLDKISQKAVQELVDKEQKERNKGLDDLRNKLCHLRDKRPLHCLDNLRTMYSDFRKDVQSGKISKSVTTVMLGQIDEMFSVCIHSLEQHAEFQDTTKNMFGDVGADLLKQREELLQEVEKNVAELADSIAQVRTFKMRAKKAELQDLKAQLQRSREVAKQLEAFTLGSGNAQDGVIDQYSKEYQ